MKQEKQLLLDEVNEQIERHGSFVVMSYTGLNANLANAFRTKIASLGGDVQMLRKRMLCKVASTLGVELDLSELPGHIGVVFTGEDPLVATKEVFQFGKEQGEAVRVLMGRIDGRFYKAHDVERLSKLPSLPEMRAQLLGLFEAPMAQLAGTLEAVVASVIYCLDNKCKQSGEEQS